MENAKDKSSRSGSKTNLNESSLPLLEQEEVDLKGGESKVTIEMDTRVSDDSVKDEDSKEKSEGESGQTEGKGNESGKESKKSKKKDKERKDKKKEKKEDKGHQRTASLAERLTAGLNLLDRDDRNVNDHVNIIFDDVLAEPDSNHGFDSIWRLAFLIFSGTKVWIYRILSAILAIPCGFMWGLIFSLLTLFNVWLITPTLRAFEVVMYIAHKIWAAVIHTFLDPIFQSVGQLLSSINVNTTRREIIKEP